MTNLHSETPLLVAFVDLTRFMAQSKRVSDADVAATLDAYYERVAAAAEEAGGRMVKFFGDGALMVFDEDEVDRGVQALMDLKDAVDSFMDDRGWDCRLTVKAHFGTAIAGPFGAPGAKRYDVIGKTVNTAATLDATGVTLSVAAFRKLDPELRRRFKKHTASVTYIRNEDPRRFR
ncbi:MAG: adenylate/guanylate cyclase domain-containing protein [Hyphomicrobiales bacterium]